MLGIDPQLIEECTAESIPVTEAMAQHGKKLFQQADFIVACTGLLKPGGSATPEKPEGTLYISILYQDTLHSFAYFLQGSPIERLNQLTENVAREVLNLMA